ncbi:MAG: cytochrome b/b6 domain-containing protein [Zoogloea sp.]|nr:cytochrome b/b6 domain-containing protein [Zoogloea sp.]
MTYVRVWDLPLRVFHWLLAVAVAAAMLTGQVGGNLMVWHGRLGILIAGLIGFRLAWGLVGSTHSRFSSFVRGPAAIAAYLRGGWHGLGHNPLGALSVLGLLTVLGLQAGGGLFANDDIAFQGPLYGLVSKDTSDWMTGLHRKGFWLVLTLVALHIAAIVFYTRVKGEKLVGAMLSGQKEVADHRPVEAPTGGGAIALLFAIAVGIASAWVASGAWMPPPPPPEPAAAPAW